MKNVINSFSHDLWLSNLTDGWLMIKSDMSNNKVTYPSDHGYVRSRDKRASLYIYFRKLIATKIDQVMACEIKISTTV